MQDFIRIHEKDNVIVAVRSISAGETLAIDGQTVMALDDIPAGHKMALRDISWGEQVVKYGYPIGNASRDIRAGEWVHTHNVKTGLGELLEYTYEPVGSVEMTVDVSGKDEAQHSIEYGVERQVCGIGCKIFTISGKTFQGFSRPNGKVGIRNDIWIIPTVGCVNNVAEAIAGQAKQFVGGSVDDVIAFTHPYGCSQMGEDQENTRKILADLINHPNAGGVLVLGLGCENSGIEELKKYIGTYDSERVKFLVAQEVEDEIAEGVLRCRELIRHAAEARREPIPVSKLIVGLKCGGSDGFSGITANPCVGQFSDMLIAAGGTTILTEVPEMFGAETILMNRCADEALFDRTVTLINDFKNYFTAHNQTIYENPSPGNKQGGISTLEDKSLGCTQKAGSSPVRGVLAYGEPVMSRGLNLLSAPGNDLVAATALAASGAHMVLFTTERGTPFASPVPTVKISTNTALAGKKSGWIDFNAGVLLEDKSMAEVSEALFDYVIEVASGRKVCAEKNGYHDMAIFKQGVTL